MTGFTGVDWDARTSQQLATDLGHGPGPAPLVDAGLAWAQLSAELGEAALEYGAVLARLGVHWRSSHSHAALEKLTALAPWLGRAAAEAAENAGRAEAQAAAVAVARLTMPNLAEIDFVDDMREMATAATTVVPIIAGATAQLERAVHEQRMRAARVMQAYETASEQVAQPWAGVAPAPGLVSDGPLNAEQAAERRAAQGAHTSDHARPAPHSAAPMGGYVPVAYEKQKYAHTTLAGGRPTVAPVTPTVSPAATTTSAMPPVVPPATAMGSGDRVVVRAADHSEGSGTHSAASESDTPLTWSEVALADRPVVAGTAGPVDPRYAAETLLLGTDGGR